MQLVPQTAEQKLVIGAVLRGQVKDPATISLGIHEADQMYAHSLSNVKGDKTAALVEYYTTGVRILSIVRQIIDWHFGSFGPITAFLDFACGYGRFTRFLAQELPPERIWSSDIYPGTVDFQREYFGVNGIVSVTQPDQFHSGRQYDCVLASSFFTHAPEATFDTWLEALYRLLKPDGVMIFSALDIHTFPEQTGRVSTPLMFVPGSYDPNLPARDFGRTYVHNEHIPKVFKTLSEDKATVRRIPLGMEFHQDLYVVTKRSDRGVTELDFAYPPQAYHGVWKTRTSDFHIEGWASDHYNPAGWIEDIRLIVNGEVKQRCTPDIDRPDVAVKLKSPAAARSGWSFTVDQAAVQPGDVAVIEVVNGRGLKTVMYCEGLKN